MPNPTFYARGDGTWTVLGFDSIEDWLEEQDEAAVDLVPASRLEEAVEALDALAATVRSVLDSLAFAAPEAYAMHLGRLVEAVGR